MIEHAVTGYTGNATPTSVTTTPANAATPTNVCYSFTNIELQSYTVTKTWAMPNDVSYLPKDSSGKFTSTFKLQQRIGNGPWTDCTAPGTRTLTANENASGIWTNLPKYTTDGTPITYRAVETHINGTAIATDTDGNYIVTYDYDKDGTSPDNKANPAFDDTRTDATNRLVYGFVDLSKMAAYLASGHEVTKTDLRNPKLSGVEFTIQKKGADGRYADYATEVLTGNNGRLINAQGKYGKEQRYLIPGDYRLMEVNTHSDNYSPWASGVEFKVGLADNTTGEHGTAWISTDITGGKLDLKVNYLPPNPPPTGHSFNDVCAPRNDSLEAYNLESRGVIKFTKTGDGGKPLDVHTGSYGESPAYFGVYTDKNCTTQVAGMKAGTDKTGFVLTNKANATTTATDLPTATNTDGIPYLRRYGTNEFTLLSGTYYVKELVPPAGYKRDDTVRTVTIAKLNNIPMSSALGSVYSGNAGTFADGNTTSYQWTNTPNKVTIYKMDQFGRNVTLNSGGYLELKFKDGKFPTGEDTIRLYQDPAAPAKNATGTSLVGNSTENGAWSIRYTTGTDPCWTITGLFDAGKSYTLSEHPDAAPDDNVVAKPITFTIDEKGLMDVATSTDTHTSRIDSNTNITEASGRHNVKTDGFNDYNNYYQPSAGNNKVVLRDVARFRKNVALKKIVIRNGQNKPLQYISFNLYHGKPGDPKPGLVTNPPLTTDENGVIDLSKLDPRVINQITKAPLKNGLDLGDYFFREMEMGASDGYRLANDIAFSIVPVSSPTGLTENMDSEEYYAAFAEVKFTTRTDVTQNDSGNPDRATVTNLPVQSRSLNLTKQDEVGTTPLSDAKFRLEYVSITNGDEGSKTNSGNKTSTTPTVKEYTTNADGALVDGEGHAPDISAKGTYTLTEIQAPSNHSTFTTTNTNIATTTTLPMLKFKVGSDNTIQFATSTDTSYIQAAIAGTGLVGTPATGTNMTVTVTNHKTSLTIDKRSDLSNNIKTKNQHDVTGEALKGAELAIYEGVGTSGSPIWTNSGNTGTSTWELVRGILRENTVYTLHEVSAPTGYMKAEDLYFCLFGTRGTGINNGTSTGIESQVYVWTDDTAPTVNAVTPTDLSASGSKWSPTRNLDSDNDLTMVDEAIIAPVDTRKVLERTVGTTATYTDLLGAEFTVSVTGGPELGIAVSGEDGHLTWKSLTADALNGTVCNTNGKRITTDTDVKDQRVILQQNAAGYTFKETSAPVHAYNNGGEYHVAISEQNYRDYKEHPTWAIDLVKANENTADHTTSLVASPSNLVNHGYQSIVTLHKYDSAPEANQKGIAGTQFTLFRFNGTRYQVYDKASVTVGTKKENAAGVFITGDDGNLSITIPDKGAYMLKETAAATGYELDESNGFIFALTDEKQNSVATPTVLKKDDIGVPNGRKYGTVSLTKSDAGTNELLDGVVYTLERKDPPNGITQYFSVATPTVITGKSYTATYTDVGTEKKWKLTEADGQTGKITISGLDWGTYTLSETTEKSGYKLDMTDTDQKAAHTKTYIITHEAHTRSLAETDTNTKNSVTFHKTSASNTDLAGAVFEVRDASNNRVHFYKSAVATTTDTQVTSGANGTVTIYGLPTATNTDTPTRYKLVEVKAPVGYVVNPNPVEFTIDRKGVVRLSGSDDPVSEVPMVDKSIHVTLKKLAGGGSSLLKGTVFTLEPDGTKGPAPDNISHFLSGSDSPRTLILSEGTYEIPSGTLIGGHSYILKETFAPQGFKDTAKVYFTVGTDGQVTVDNTEGGYRVTDTNGKETCCEVTNETWDTGEYKSTLSIRDETEGIILTKVDSYATNTTLKGVRFTLEPYGENSHFSSIFANMLSNGKYTPTTDNDGMIIIPDGMMACGGQFLLKETATASGYYLSKEAKDGVILNVDANGSVTMERRAEYQGRTDPCPASLETRGGLLYLTVKNPKAAAFEFTKRV